MSDNEPRVLELSNSLARGQAHSAAGCRIGCVVPKMRAWLTPQNRFLVGMEAMRVQGISYSDNTSGEKLLGSSSSLFA